MTHIIAVWHTHMAHFQGVSPCGNTVAFRPDVQENPQLTMDTAIPPTSKDLFRPPSIVAARALAWGEWLLIVLLGIRLVHWLSLPEHTQQSDFRIFYAAASRLIHGLSPYGFAVRPGMFFVQPPWFALLLGPLALLPLDWARACWMTMNLGFLVSIVFMAARLVNVALGLRRIV